MPEATYARLGYMDDEKISLRCRDCAYTTPRVFDRAESIGMVCKQCRGYQWETMDGDPYLTADELREQAQVLTGFGYHTMTYGVHGDGAQVRGRTHELVTLDDAKAQLIKTIEEADEGTTLTLSLCASQWH